MFSMKRHALLLLALVLASSGCRHEETGSAQFAVSVAQVLSASSVSRVTVTSSGVDMPSVTTELVQTNGVWAGVIGNIPAGSNREFRARAFDSSNALLFEGASSSVTISANQTTLVAITLQEAHPPPSFSNEAPIIESVTATPTTVQLGSSVALQAIALDPDAGDTLSYAWTAPAGSFTAASNPSTAWIAPSTAGAVSLTLTVNDSRGASSAVTITVSVVNASSEGGAAIDVRFNSYPVVSAISALRTRVDVGEFTTVSVTASDNDGDSLSYHWTSTCAGTWTNATASTTSFSPSARPLGACNNCQMTVTISDGRNGQTTGSLAFCVASTATNRFPPTIVRANQSSLTAQPSQQLTFEVTASDPQNSTLTFTWSASRGSVGMPQSSATTSRVVWTAPACVPTGTTVSMTATVTNAYGLATPRTFGVTGLPTCAVSGWASTGSTSLPRHYSKATLQPNGKVLVTGGVFGGDFLASAEVYDPGMGTWASTGSMASPREQHTSMLLPTGKVLIVGGRINTSSTAATAETYDPATGIWSPAGSMASPRWAHVATLLPNGKVLVSGGAVITVLAAAEVYNPTTGSWLPAGSMTAPRHHHTATLLNSGKVLITGGHDGFRNLVTAELYDLATDSWSPTGSMASGRRQHTATLLPNGKVLITGGISDSGPLVTAEVYDPATGSWSSTGSMAVARGAPSATLLPDGRVFVTGGANDNSLAETYDPATGSWSPAGSMASSRIGHVATLLNSGQVLVAGGYNGSYLATAEVYTP